MNGRHTIPGKKPWEYPVLKKFSTLRIMDGWERAHIHYGIQDGWWVTGCDCQYLPMRGGNTSTGSGGSGCYPGRKWGEFFTKQEALAYTLRYVREKFVRPKILKLIDEQLAAIGPVQLSIFNHA